MSGMPASSPTAGSAASPASLSGGVSASTNRADVVPLANSISTDAVRARLDEHLTRCFYSASGYVFECDPYAVADDGALMKVFAAIREADRRHAHLIGAVIQRRGGVPQTGVFPWWDLDLNFLTVPTLARFVLETLREDVALYDATLAGWPADDLDSRATLSWIRGDKVRQVEELTPVVDAAVRREAEATKAAIEVVKKGRAARIAKERAAAEAAKKAKAAAGAKPVAGAPAKPAAAAPAASPAVLLDPNEPGISKKEKGRRAVMRLRAQHGIKTPGAPVSAAPAAGGASAAPAAAGAELLDPNEPGISAKEKAKRQMLKMRAASAPAASAPAAAPVAAPVVELLDPNEPGLSPKEKAKRQMLKLRAASAPAASAPAAAPVGAPVVELLDPNEPGISAKEKAKRQMLKMRAASAPAPASAPAAAPVAAPVSAPAPVVEDLGDPDEPGISPKEKARRKVARMRAQAK